MAKNPTLKRIMKEAAELASSPSADYHAAPLENDMYEWHFTLRGPPEHGDGTTSPYAGGVYHGRIALPPAYPLKPPSFRFLTPTGRFEVNREICLSISGHHEETWQPAWGIRTALVAIRSFMDTDAKGQLGGMEASDEVRKRFAGQSTGWRCPVCSKSNGEIMREQDDAVKEAGGGSEKKDVVPEELRLAYKEDLAKESTTTSPDALSTTGGAVADTQPITTSAARVDSLAPPARQRLSRALTPDGRAPGTATAQALHQQRQQHARAQEQRAEATPAWIDKAIYGIVVLLAILLFRKLS